MQSPAPKKHKAMQGRPVPWAAAQAHCCTGELSLRFCSLRVDHSARTQPVLTLIYTQPGRGVIEYLCHMGFRASGQHSAD